MAVSKRGVLIGKRHPAALRPRLSVVAAECTWIRAPVRPCAGPAHEHRGLKPRLASGRPPRGACSGGLWCCSIRMRLLIQVRAAWRAAPYPTPPLHRAQSTRRIGTWGALDIGRRRRRWRPGAARQAPSPGPTPPLPSPVLRRRPGSRAEPRETCVATDRCRRNRYLTGIPSGERTAHVAATPTAASPVVLALRQISPICTALCRSLCPPAEMPTNRCPW